MRHLRHDRAASCMNPRRETTLARSGSVSTAPLSELYSVVDWAARFADEVNGRGDCATASK